MKANMGRKDKAIRSIIAVVLALLVGTGTISGGLGYVFLGVAAIFALTSLIGFCPLYTLLGINTCAVK